MSKTSPPVFHPRGRWRGQDRKHRPPERIFFSAPRNSSLTRHPRSCNLLYTRIYIYIFSISSLSLTMAVFHTQWNRLHRTGIYHRILERGSSYKSGALVKFLLASKRRLPFTVPSLPSPPPHSLLSLSLSRVCREERSPFLFSSAPRSIRFRRSESI